MQHRNSYIELLSRRAWICIRAIVVGMVLVTTESAFMPRPAEPMVPKLQVESPFLDTRIDLLNAIDKTSGKRLSELEKIELCDIVAEMAAKYRMDPMLIMGVIAVESEFYTHARSSVGALGLMQLRPSTAFEWSGRIKTPMHELGLFDRRTNIELGAAYLRFLRDRLGSWSMALASYNWGPTTVLRAVKAHGSIPKKMRHYEQRVTKAKESLKRAAKAKALVAAR